ncbi:hypothetical protein LTR10_003402 [Elasticomyces elasticus]|nr:hypothetical protein LTR10_003402 [Elasticomyces elasticus]KAK4969670.1 hypothetical protein LTR42_008942 [Elasticomyces elasticus]
MLSTTIILALVASISTALAAHTNSAPLPQFSLVADYSGKDFFSAFDFFTGEDPTGGAVSYVDAETAAQKRYTGFVDNKVTGSTNAYIGVDYTSVTPKRESVRLSSKHTYEVGSIVTIDVYHMPSAFGAWPALWMLGDIPGGTWPDTNGGEIDILEVVHNSSTNAMTLHTGPGCTVNNAAHLFQGQLQDPNCNAGDPQPGTTGCSVQAVNQAHTRGATLATAGAPFNQQMGGVYVLVWMKSGISVYLLNRESLPADLIAGNPMPETWHKTMPLAKFSGQGCDWAKTFSNMRIVTDTTFCGQWSGKQEVWESFGGPAATGSSTCADYVQNNPAAFKDAYFEIASIKVFGRNGKMPAIKTASKRDANDVADMDTAERHNRNNNTSVAETKHIGHHGHRHGLLKNTHSHRFANASAPCNTSSAANTTSAQPSTLSIVSKKKQESIAPGMQTCTFESNRWTYPIYTVNVGVTFNGGSGCPGIEATLTANIKTVPYWGDFGMWGFKCQDDGNGNTKLKFEVEGGVGEQVNAALNEMYAGQVPAFECM